MLAKLVSNWPNSRLAELTQWAWDSQDPLIFRPLRTTKPSSSDGRGRNASLTSDERTEYLIRDRLSFMGFLGLGLADTVPDANTIWGFREALPGQDRRPAGDRGSV